MCINGTCNTDKCEIKKNMPDLYLSLLGNECLCEIIEETKGKIAPLCKTQFLSNCEKASQNGNKRIPLYQEVKFSQNIDENILSLLGIDTLLSMIRVLVKRINDLKANIYEILFFEKCSNAVCMIKSNIN